MTIKDNEFLNAKHYANVVAGLAIFQDDPLVSPPGTKFNLLERRNRESVR